MLYNKEIKIEEEVATQTENISFFVSFLCFIPFALKGQKDNP